MATLISQLLTISWLTVVSIFDKQVDQDEVAPEVELSALVNYIQPVHFKSFEISDSKYNLVLLYKHREPMTTLGYFT